MDTIKKYMMDDLISRQAAIESIKDPVIKGFALYALKNVPSVPAVPLGKLCELLATNADCPPEHSPIMDHCIENKCAECWKTVLKEWTEGLDAAD